MAEKLPKKIMNGKSAYSGRNLFDIFYSMSSETPPGALPMWTGEKINSCNTLYPEFWNKALQLKRDKKIRVITDAQYEKEISAPDISSGNADGATQFGQTGAFVIDENTGYLRLPKITGFIQTLGGDGGSSVGVAQLDAIRNITGSHLGDNSQVETTGEGTPIGHLTGAFYNKQTLGNYDLASTPSGNGGILAFDSSRIVPTASFNRPKNVIAALYIQVYNPDSVPDSTFQANQILEQARQYYEKSVDEFDSIVKKSDFIVKREVISGVRWYRGGENVLDVTTTALMGMYTATVAYWRSGWCDMWFTLNPNGTFTGAMEDTEVVLPFSFLSRDEYWVDGSPIETTQWNGERAEAPGAELSIVKRSANSFRLGQNNGYTQTMRNGVNIHISGWKEGPYPIEGWEGGGGGSTTVVGTGGGVIDGSIFKELEIPLTGTGIKELSYIVENDCYLTIASYQMTFINDSIIEYKVNGKRIVSFGEPEAVNPGDDSCYGFPVKAGATVTVVANISQLFSGNKFVFTEYKLNSIAPQVAMPDWDQTKCTNLASGDSITTNGYVLVNGTSNWNCELKVNTIQVFRSQYSTGNTDYQPGIVPVAKGDVVTYTRTGNCTVTFFPCKTVDAKITTPDDFSWSEKFLLAGCDVPIWWSAGGVYDKGVCDVGYRSRYNLSDGKMRIHLTSDWMQCKFIEFIFTNGEGGNNHSTSGLVRTSYLKNLLDTEFELSRHDSNGLVHGVAIPMAYNSVKLGVCLSIKNQKAVATTTYNNYPVVDASKFLRKSEHWIDKDSIGLGTTLTLSKGSDQSAVYWKGFGSLTIDEGVAMYGNTFLTFITLTDMDLLCIYGYK